MKKRDNSFYLSGASGNVTSQERNEWRDYIYQYLTELGYEIYNPNHYFNYENDSDIQMKIIMDFYLKTIMPKVDVVVVNLKNCNNSIGTACEIGAAIALNKMIIGIRGDNCYPYIEESCSYLCNSYEEAAEFIAAHF